MHRPQTGTKGEVVTGNDAALGGAFQESGDVRPVDDLQQQGIRKVRVLSQSQLGEVLRVAVNRAVRRQLGELDLPIAVLEQLRDATELEYARLLAEGLERAPAPVTPPPPPPPAQVAPRPAPQPAQLAPDPAPAPPSAELDGMEERMAQNISQLLQKDWRSDLQQVQESQQSKLELLEQRISKLVGALESTDRLVSQIKDTRATNDPAGSADDAAGGLDPDSPLIGRKSELLSALFQANMELRELQGRAGDEATGA